MFDLAIWNFFKRHFEHQDHARYQGKYVFSGQQDPRLVISDPADRRAHGAT